MINYRTNSIATHHFHHRNIMYSTHDHGADPDRFLKIMSVDHLDHHTMVMGRRNTQRPEPVSKIQIQPGPYVITHGQALLVPAPILVICWVWPPWIMPIAAVHIVLYADVSERATDQKSDEREILIGGELL